MRRRRAFQLSVEPLEVRVLPAAVTVSKGAMTISNQVGNLLVETTDVAGQIRVTDDSGTNVYDGVKSKIVINGTNGNDAINVVSSELNETFFGLLDIRSGAGDDIVSVSGRFGGNVSVQTGLGNDIFTSVEGLQVFGSLTYSDTTGFNTVAGTGGDWQIGQNMTVTGASIFSMDGGSSLGVFGSLTINSQTSSGSGVHATLAGEHVWVGGNLKITGGSGDDFVILASPDLRIGGSVNLNLKGGMNTLSVVSAGPESGVYGTFTYTGTNGTDTVLFGGDMFYAGNVTLNLGNGFNTVTTTGTPDFLGSVAINYGTGTNMTFLSQGSIAGNLGIKHAGGQGSMTSISTTIGGKLIYRSGSSTLDHLLVAIPSLAQPVVNVDIQYGAGQHHLMFATAYTGKVTGPKNAAITYGLI